MQAVTRVYGEKRWLDELAEELSREEVSSASRATGMDTKVERQATTRLPDESFEFLGYTIGRCYSPKTGRAYYGTRPSKLKVQQLCRDISEMTSRRWTLVDVEDRIDRLNRKLIGWANYFCLGPVSKACAAADSHARHRLRQWLCAKHKTQGQGTSRYPDEYLHQTLGLTRLSMRTRNFSWAKT